MFDDGASGRLFDFAVSRNRLRCAGDDIAVDVVATACADKHAPLIIEASQKVDALHAYSMVATKRRVS